MVREALRQRPRSEELSYTDSTPVADYPFRRPFVCCGSPAAGDPMSFILTFHATTDEPH
jgi:hypothetical protein